MKHQLDEKLLELLNKYPEKKLKMLKKSPKSAEWARKRWVNAKLYLRNSYVNGNEDAKFLYKGEICNEIPCNRDIFYCGCATRFWIQNHATAYLARDLAIATYEIVVAFRDQENFLQKDTEPHWRNERDDYSDYTLHHVTRFISQDCKLLDLYDPRLNPGSLLHFIEERNQQYKSFYNNFLTNRDVNIAYPKTRALAKWALECGFDGIVYKSSRNPKDIAGGKCLVMFSRDKVVPSKIL